VLAGDARELPQRVIGEVQPLAGDGVPAPLANLIDAGNPLQIVVGVLILEVSRASDGQGFSGGPAGGIVGPGDHRGRRPRSARIGVGEHSPDIVIRIRIRAVGVGGIRKLAGGVVGVAGGAAHAP
jgi:hypothetical protein